MPDGSVLFLVSSKDTAQDSFGCTNYASESAAVGVSATGDGKHNVLEVNVSVSVLVFDEASEASQNVRNQSCEGFG